MEKFTHIPPERQPSRALRIRFSIARMRLLARTLLPALLLAVACAAAARPAIDPADLARRIHGRINAERARMKLPALAWDGALARIAAAHSRDMAKRGYVAHQSPEGNGFSYRYRQGGYSCAIRQGRTLHKGAENIALGSLYASVRTVNGVATYDWNSAEELARRAVEGWMSSPGHRRNILTPYWRHEGIGVAIGADSRVYITQNFC
jgi:uncharacterized protein YkwD